MGRERTLRPQATGKFPVIPTGRISGNARPFLRLATVGASSLLSALGDWLTPMMTGWNVPVETVRRRRSRPRSRRPVASPRSNPLWLWRYPRQRVGHSSQCSTHAFLLRRSRARPTMRLYRCSKGSQLLSNPSDEQSKVRRRTKSGKKGGRSCKEKGHPVSGVPN